MIDWTIKKTIKVKNVSKRIAVVLVGGERYLFEAEEIREIPHKYTYIKTDGSGDLYLLSKEIKVVEDVADLVVEKPEPINNRFEILDI